MSNKSRSTQQRRIKGQHTDPSASSVDDLMMEVAPPSGNSGMMFLQHLKRDGAEPAVPVSTTLSADETVHLQSEARAQVLKLWQEKGEAAVQSALQQQIQATKKKESDIAVARKRGEAAGREKDQLVSELHRLTTAKTTIELQCKAMQADIKKQDEETARIAAELVANRGELRTKIERDINDLEDKMKKMEDEDGPLEAENATLREECSLLKKEFDEAFASYEKTWAANESETSGLIKELQEILQRTELLDAKLALSRRESQMMADAAAVFKEQVKTYEERFSAFEDVSIKSEEIERATEMQKSKLQERLTSAEAEKKEAHEIRVQLEKDTLALRSKAATLKKKLPQLERAKTQLETKCRSLPKS